MLFSERRAADRRVLSYPWAAYRRARRRAGRVDSVTACAGRAMAVRLTARPEGPTVHFEWPLRVRVPTHRHECRIESACTTAPLSHTAIVHPATRSAVCGIREPS